MAKRKPPSSHVLKEARDKRHRKSKRTRVDGGGPSQRGSTLSELQLAGGKPKSRTRGTKQNFRCDLAWTPGRVGGLGQSHWQVTGPSLREPRKGRGPAVRAVSQSSAGSAAEDAQHSRKSGSRRDAPSLPACKSPTRRSLNPECGILRPQLHAQPEPCAQVPRCEVGARPQ